ncbi:MAG: hypothetical protein ACRD36_09620, partial [Candidatus Acidiferrum sp.]
QSLDPRVVEIENKLAKPITDPGSEPLALDELLKSLLTKGHDIKYKIAQNAFREAGVIDVDRKLVTHPRVNNVQLGDVLRRVLAQVDATFRVVEDTIIIIPANRK